MLSCFHSNRFLLTESSNSNNTCEEHQTPSRVNLGKEQKKMLRRENNKRQKKPTKDSRENSDFHQLNNLSA